jgi:hypothetical protein
MFSTRTAICLVAATLSLGLLGQSEAADGKKTLQLQPVQPAAATVTLAPKVLKGAGAPDLVIVMMLPEPDPVEGLPNQGYCEKLPVGGPADRVRFAVRNQGSAASPVSTARVTFPGVGSDDKTVVALAPGQESFVSIAIPDDCYPPTAHGSCNFVMAVDADTQVGESNESNNVVLSLCLLPGT